MYCTLLRYCCIMQEQKSKQHREWLPADARKAHGCGQHQRHRTACDAPAGALLLFAGRLCAAAERPRRDAVRGMRFAIFFLPDFLFFLFILRAAFAPLSPLFFMPLFFGENKTKPRLKFRRLRLISHCYFPQFAAVSVTAEVLSAGAAVVSALSAAAVV